MDDVKELERVAATYFGLTPSIKIPKDSDFEILHPDEEHALAEGIRIKWENYIGSESKVARISPLDIMKMKGMKNTKENYEKAVKILLSYASLHSLPVVRLGDRYLLVNLRVKR